MENQYYMPDNYNQKIKSEKIDFYKKPQYQYSNSKIKSDSDISNLFCDIPEVENFNIFSDKKELLRLKIEMIKMQISERIKINRDKIQRIDSDKLHCYNMLIPLENISSNYKPLLDKKFSDISNQKFKLESETRQEMSDCWKDLVFLRNDFVNVILEYQSSGKKEKLFE